MKNRIVTVAKPATEITKPLSMHISRYTYESLSRDKISIQMLQKLYSYSDIKMNTSYRANFIHKDTDDALEAIIRL